MPSTGNTWRSGLDEHSLPRGLASEHRLRSRAYREPPRPKTLSSTRRADAKLTLSLASAAAVQGATPNLADVRLGRPFIELASQRDYYKHSSLGY